MTANQLARKLAKGNGKTVDELEVIIRQRNRDIEIGGFARAFGIVSFEKDSLMTFEKAEWLKEEGRLNNV